MDFVMELISEVKFECIANGVHSTFAHILLEYDSASNQFSLYRR